MSNQILKMNWVHKKVLIFIVLLPLARFWNLEKEKKHHSQSTMHLVIVSVARPVNWYKNYSLNETNTRNWKSISNFHFKHQGNKGPDSKSGSNILHHYPNTLVQRPDPGMKKPMIFVFPHTG